MRFEIKGLQRQFGFSIIYVTHDQSEAMALSDRIMVMSDGIVRQIDTPLNVYNHPSDAFVFGFIGLSNFVPLVISDGAAYIEGSTGIGPISREIPPWVNDSKVTLACRPSEIDITGDGGVPGIVKEKAYLGEIIDYRIQIGPAEIRVQKPRRQRSFEVGQPCNLIFGRVLWYPRQGETSGP